MNCPTCGKTMKGGYLFAPKDGAISFEEREAAAYNEAAVLAAKQGSDVRAPSQLQNFPVQLKLVPPNAPWFEGADLLISADCCAYACGSFHTDYMRGKVTVVGCPKLDGVDYTQKLTQILSNPIRSITVVRMQVPCCGGLPFAVKNALEATGKEIPLQIITLSPNGDVIAIQ